MAGNVAATSEEFVGGQSQTVEGSNCEFDRGARGAQLLGGVQSDFGLFIPYG
jgi:hypothetical protein